MQRTERRHSRPESWRLELRARPNIDSPRIQGKSLQMSRFSGALRLLLLHFADVKIRRLSFGGGMAFEEDDPNKHSRRVLVDLPEISGLRAQGLQGLWVCRAPKVPKTSNFPESIPRPSIYPLKTLNALNPPSTL